MFLRELFITLGLIYIVYGSLLYTIYGLTYISNVGLFVIGILILAIGYLLPDCGVVRCGGDEE